MRSISSVRRSLVLIALSFLLWGVLRSLDDILVALFQASFTLPYAIAMLVHFSFFSAYLLGCIPAGIYLRHYGYRNSLVCALMMMTAGSAICMIALWLHVYQFCLAGVFVIGIGIAVLQTAANPCVSLLGPEGTATARLLLVQCFNALGAMLSPLAGTILFGTWTRLSPAQLAFPRTRLATIYLAATSLLFLLSIVVKRSFASILSQKRSSHGSGWNLLRHRPLLCGIVATFLYVGTEATLLGHSIPYLSGHGRTGFLPSTAATLLSVYWGAVIIGRISAAQLLRRVHTRTLLQGASVLAFCLIQVSIFGQGSSASAALLATGLCNAVIFPAIFSLSTAGLKVEELPHASALLSTSMCGGAVLPILSGTLADHFGITTAFALPSLVYAFIALGATIFFPPDYHLQNS
ncbi:MAG: MFS transporter [Acidobacteriaceae bacterium]|nr:MFS transporter [Acidobacteriaceae bacterium]